MRLFNPQEVIDLHALGFHVNNGEARIGRGDRGIAVYCSEWFTECERRRGVFAPDFGKPFLADPDAGFFVLLRKFNFVEFDDPITAAIWLITEHSNRLS